MPHTHGPKSHQPARPFGSHDFGTSSYIGWSPKIHRFLSFDNRLEFHHWLMLESMPQVTELCERSPAVPLGGYEHVFDMWVRWWDGREECRQVVPSWKYAPVDGLRMQPPEWPTLTAWGRKHGYICTLVTEQDLAVHGTRISNWRRILPFVKFAEANPDPELEERVVSRLGASLELPLGELIRTVDAPKDALITAIVARLLHAGKVSADLDQSRFGPQLLLHLNAQADGGSSAGAG